MSGCAGVKAARMMKRSGAALMRRKVERRKSLMGKLGVERNNRTLGCDGVFGKRRRNSEKEKGDFFG